MNTCGMIHNAFAVENNIVGVEDRIRMEVAQTFMVADNVHKQCDVSPVHDDAYNVGVQEEDPSARADVDSVDPGEDEPTAAAGEGLNRE